MPYTISHPRAQVWGKNLTCCNITLAAINVNLFITYLFRCWKARWGTWVRSTRSWRRLDAATTASASAASTGPPRWICAPPKTTLKGPGHEMEFKYLDKNVRYNSSSKSVPLLGFEFSKFGNSTRKMCSSYPQPLIENITVVLTSSVNFSYQ